MRQEPVEEDLWDLLESNRTKPYGEKSNGGKLKLPMRPDPQLSGAPRIHRDPSKIPPCIRGPLRGVCRGETPWPVTICGDPGTGKTRAALVVADFVHGSQWFTWDDFVRKCNTATSGKLSVQVGTEDKIFDWERWWRYLDQSHLLVLDDVGCRGVVSEAAYEVMKTALDRREGRGLIFTTNLDVNKIADIFDARVADRLAAGTLINATGGSLR